MTAEPEQHDTNIYLTTLRALFWVVCIGVFAFAAVQAWPVVMAVLNVLTPFILGLIFAYVLHPIVLFVQHKLRLGRGTGILVVGLIILAVVVGFSAVLLPILFSQVRSLIEGVTRFFNEGDFINKLFGNMPESDRENIRLMISDGLAKLRETLDGIMAGNTAVLKPVAEGSFEAAGHTVHAALAAFGWLGSVVATTAITTIATAWYLVEMPEIPGVVRRLMPEGPNRRRYWAVLTKANAGIGGFLRGQLIACVGVGILTTILMLFVGPKKYAILIGFMAGAVNFIPYLGPTVGAAPAVLWALFAPGFEDMGDRLVQVGMIAAGFGAIQAIDGFIFQPFIVGPQAALHPLAVMLALVTGAQFGVGGMILAVPIASALKVVFVEMYWKHTSDFVHHDHADAEAPTLPPGGDAG